MLYPLRFESVFLRYLWGGHRLETRLNKPCGPDSAAESWEIVDHGEHQSIVKFGSLRGQTLQQLMRQFGSQLVGNVVWDTIQQASTPPALRGRFPLLFKFLDAHQALSIQVHPDDAYAAGLTPPDLGKTEAWYVMHAEPGSRIYSGLKAGVTQSDFANAVAQRQTALLMHTFEPQVGDVVFIPAGTMHALGAGLLIAEIQQASNTTFRVYDWDRVDGNGVPRPLHLEQALAVTRFDQGPVEPIRIEHSPAGSLTPVSQRLIQDDKFQLNHHILPSAARQSLEPVESFRILVVTQGELQIEADPAGVPLRVGDVSLIPADWDLSLQSLQPTEFLEIKP